MIELVALGAAALLAADHGSTPFDALFSATARARGVPGNLLRALARVESNFRPNAVSSTGDHGLLQLNTRTLESLGVPETSWSDPAVNLDSGARYLLQLQSELGSRYNAVSLIQAYHVGPDLQPHEEAQRYSNLVLWHWLLYDIGRLGRS